MSCADTATIRPIGDAYLTVAPFISIGGLFLHGDVCLECTSLPKASFISPYQRPSQAQLAETR